MIEALCPEAAPGSNLANSFTVTKLDIIKNKSSKDKGKNKINDGGKDGSKNGGKEMNCTLNDAAAAPSKDKDKESQANAGSERVKKNETVHVYGVVKYPAKSGVNEDGDLCLLGDPSEHLDTRIKRAIVDKCDEVAKSAWTRIWGDFTIQVIPAHQREVLEANAIRHAHNESRLEDLAQLNLGN